MGLVYHRSFKKGGTGIKVPLYKGNLGGFRTFDTDKRTFKTSSYKVKAILSQSSQLQAYTHSGLSPDIALSKLQFLTQLRLKTGVFQLLCAIPIVLSTVLQPAYHCQLHLVHLDTQHSLLPKRD